jgi:hypothetical protein
MKKLIVIIAGLALASAAFAQVDPSRPMVTGRGNVDRLPGKVLLTNQTADKTGDSVKLEKYVVTGSLLPHAAVKVAARP